MSLPTESPTDRKLDLHVSNPVTDEDETNLQSMKVGRIPIYRQMRTLRKVWVQRVLCARRWN
jgi:hypothetical protein